jgi:hypothetical protein
MAEHTRHRSRSRRSLLRHRTLERGLAELAEAERRAVRRARCDTVRAVQDERLRRLEQDLVELRGRVNGLIFLVLGTVTAQLMIRLLT